MLVKNRTFHDLVFKDMNNRNEHDCQDLASQVLKCFYFCNSMSQVVTMIAIFKTLLSKS